MGYETKMYICIPCLGRQETLIQIEGHKSAYTIYNENGKKADYFYLADGNTKRYVSGLKRNRVDYEIAKAEVVQVVAMVDLCKASCDDVGDVIDKGHLKDGERGGIYDSGGNAVIVEDCYGDPMTFVDPKRGFGCYAEGSGERSLSQIYRCCSGS